MRRISGYRRVVLIVGIVALVGGVIVAGVAKSTYDRSVAVAEMFRQLSGTQIAADQAAQSWAGVGTAAAVVGVIAIIYVIVTRPRDTTASSE